MKKFILFAALLAAGPSLWAQECDALESINQNFESAIVPAMPACTVAINEGDGNNWVTTANPGFGFTDNVLHYPASGQPADAWFFTRGIELTAGTFYKISYTYGNDSGDTSEDLVVTLGTAPTAAAAQTFNTHAVTGGAPVVHMIDLYPAAANGTHYLGFHATSAANQGNLYVDNIIFEEVVCGTPSNVAVTNITQGGATISWGPPTGGNTTLFSVYQYAVTETNTPPADGTYSPETSVDLINLLPGTTYYLFTRALCGPVWSDWTESIAFTIPPCEFTTVPYSLDFETAVVPGVPDCTVAVDAETGNNWGTSNNPGSGFINNTLHYTGNDDPADAWFFTQGVQLNAGTYYKVTYQYGNDSGETTENLLVAFGQNPSPTFMTTDFMNHPSISGGTLEEASVDYFNVPASGVYYFGFNAYSDASQGSLYIDDFLIEEQECGTPSNVEVTDITATTATVTWEAPVTGNSDIVSVYQYAYGTTDTPPAEGTFEPGLTAELTDLQPETTYYVFTRTQCGPLWSDWTTTSFTTDVLGTTEHSFKELSYYPNPVKDLLNISNATVIEKVEVYNITGQLVHSQAVSAENASVNISGLAAGAYLVTITGESGLKRIKIIKE